MSRTGKVRQKADCDCPERAVDEEWGVTENGYKVSFWADENVLELDRAGGCTV